MWNILLQYAFIFIIVFPFFMLIRKFAYGYIKLKNKELAILSEKTNNSYFQAKLQAYEKMVVFLERLKPSNLINNFNDDLKTKEFVFLLNKSIREEFEYNISQQLYINEESWRNIINSKNNILHLVHKLLETYPNASLQEFKSLLLMNYLEGEDYISHSIHNLKLDISSFN